MTDFDISLLDSSATLNRGYKSVINNAGWAIAIITLAVAVLVTFTDIGFVGGINENITSTVMLMLLASYLIYFSMESAGEKLGRESEEYREALTDYKARSKEIKPEDIYALRKFCTDYSKEELIYRRNAYLMKYGLTPRDYEGFKSGEKFSYRTNLILRRAERMKPAALTPRMLLSFDVRDESELHNPEKTKLLRMIPKLLPITVSVFFTGALVLAAKDGLTVMTMIEGILKLSALPIIALRGYVGGYTYTKERQSVWLSTKSKLLHSFICSKCDGFAEEQIENKE